MDKCIRHHSLIKFPNHSLIKVQKEWMLTKLVLETNFSQEDQDEGEVPSAANQSQLLAQKELGLEFQPVPQCPPQRARAGPPLPCAAERSPGGGHGGSDGTAAGGETGLPQLGWPPPPSGLASG